MFLMPCSSATEDLHLLRGSNENELDRTEQNGFMIDTPQIVPGTNSLSLVDSTQKQRGKENDLGNLSYDSIADSVIHVPAKSGNIGLSTGEEGSSHLSLIPIESPMPDEVRVQEVESFNTKSRNVLKNDFLEHAKMASDQNLRAEMALVSIAETISSAGKIKTKPVQKPKRDESNLPDDEWNIVEAGTNATDTINSLIAVIPQGDSPQEIMQTFADVCDIIGAFVPAFGLVGQALGIVAGFLPGNDDEEPDPMIEYMDQRFDIIEGQLENVLNRFDEVMLHTCFTSWDEDHQNYIQDFEAAYDLFTNPNNSDETRERGYRKLFNQCEDHPPLEYINRWKNTILSTPGTFSECMQKIEDNASNRVLYLRRTFTSVVLSNLFRAARYDGICSGVETEYLKDTGRARVSIQSDNARTIEGYYRDIYDKFEELEDNMYNAPISAWNSTLQNEDKYPNAKADANVVMNALKDDFFPDHRYAAFLITKQRGNVENDRDVFEFFGHGGEEYGSFRLGGQDGKIVVVFYRKRNNRQRLSGLPRFNNCVCDGEEMCKSRDDLCGQRGQRQTICDSPWVQVHANSKWNNKNMHDLYASRGTVIVKTLSEKETCDGFCFWDDCTCTSPRRNIVNGVGVATAATRNDDITSSFDTPIEGDRVYDSEYYLKERYQYELIGISGDFECSETRGDECKDKEVCGSKCSGTAPTPSVACSEYGNPKCDRNEQCKLRSECEGSALTARSTSRHTSRSTHLANLLSKGLARTYLHKTDDFMNDDDCENGSVARTSKTCQPPPPPPTPCFSSESRVNVHQEGLVPISEIKVGDLVQSKKDGSLSRVYALEKNHYGESKFYQLLSSSGTILELTDRHMIFLKNSSNPIPARDVKVGDILATDISSEAVSGEVTKIEVIRRNGYYNPLTEDGTIILNNGVVASSFSVAKSSSSNFFDASTELIHWHTLSHLANAPLRVVCKAWFGFCTEEIFQDENGLHKFVVLLKRASNLAKWAQAIVFPFIFGMGVFFTVLELMYDKAEALLEVASSTGIGVGLLTFSLVTALAVPGLLAFRKRYFL